MEKSENGTREGRGWKRVRTELREGKRMEKLRENGTEGRQEDGKVEGEGIGREIQMQKVEN